MYPVMALGVGLRVNMPSGKTLLALTPLFVLVAALIVYSLIDLSRAPTVRYLPKAVWALIILLGSVPLGALAYLLFGKDRNDRCDIEAGHQTDLNDDHRGDTPDVRVGAGR